MYKLDYPTIQAFTITGNISMAECLQRKKIWSTEYTSSGKYVVSRIPYHLGFWESVESASLRVQQNLESQKSTV